MTSFLQCGIGTSLLKKYFYKPQEGDVKEYESQDSAIDFITEPPSKEIVSEGVIKRIALNEIRMLESQQGTVVSLIDTTAYKLNIQAKEFFTISALPSEGVFPKRSYTLSKKGFLIIKVALDEIISAVKDKKQNVAYAQFKLIRETLSKEREAVKEPVADTETAWTPLLVNDSNPTYS